MNAMRRNTGISSEWMSYGTYSPESASGGDPLLTPYIKDSSRRGKARCRMKVEARGDCANGLGAQNLPL